MKAKPKGNGSARGEAPMSARRQRRAGEILAAARALFLERGVQGTSVSEIAGRVGVVEGLVFSYFPTKRDLLHAVLGELYEPLIRDVDDGYRRLRGIRARLRFIVWRHLRVYSEAPGLARLVLHEVRTGPEYASSGLHDMLVRYTGFVRRALDDAIAEGELAVPVDAEMVRAMLYGGLEHLMWPVLHGRLAVDVNLLADRYTDLLLDGLQAHGARTPRSVEARLARLEALAAAAPRAARRAAKTS